MRALLIGHRHSLLPFAWRLVREEVEVDIVAWSRSGRYSRAWEGKFNQLLVGKEKENDEAIAATRSATIEAGAFVLTNVPRWRQVFGDYPKLFAMLSNQDPADGPYPDVQVGAWFDGEGFMGTHLLVEDRGLWPNGGGPSLPGGLTLVRPLPAAKHVLEGLLSPLADALKSEGFRGLIQTGLRYDLQTQQFQTAGLRAGWPFLHSHAFVGAVENLSAVLEGYDPEALYTYTVVLPVSQPPWPHPSSDRPPMVAFEGLPKLTLRNTFFHDIQIPGEGKVQTAGLDGLVGVVQGAADSLLLAQQRALVAASHLEFPERQLRADVANRVPAVLAGLEEVGLTVA